MYGAGFGFKPPKLDDATPFDEAADADKSSEISEPKSSGSASMTPSAASSKIGIKG